MRQPHLQQVCICFRFVLPQGNGLQTSGRTWLHLQKPGKSLGKCEERCGFAWAAANLPGIPAGMRIATPRGSKVRHVVAPKSAMPSSGQRPEQGNAPLGLLSPQSVPLCGAPWLCRPKARAGQRSLGAPLPAKGHPLRGPHALARNDMLKLGMCQRLQECPAWQNFPALCAGALPQFAMTGRRLGGAAGKLRRRRETLGEQLPAGNRWVKP